jgi:hypothetical protein
MERANFTFLSEKQTHPPVLAIHSNKDGHQYTGYVDTVAK